MHHDNIEWADHMDEWKNDPENKKCRMNILPAGEQKEPVRIGPPDAMLLMEHP